MLNRRRTKVEEVGAKQPLLNLVSRLLKGQEMQTKYSGIIASLSNNKFALAKDKIDKLRAMKLLDVESFTMVLDRVSSAQAKVAISDASIIDVGQGQVVSITNGPDFFGVLSKTDDKYLEGAYGYVVPANKFGQEEDAPDYAVKVMSGSDVACNKTAQHEARYNRMMGRSCFLFKLNGAPSLLMDWQKGTPLNKLIDKDELKSYSFGDRLEWLVALLKDINKMHENCYIHFDLLAKNVMVDVKAKKMTLLDFGISHRENPTEDDHEVSADMRDLAEHIIRLLFDKEWFTLRSVKTQAIRALYEATRSAVTEDRCTSLQALNYCNLLLKNRKGLNSQKLAEIKAQTIDRKELQVEDVLRGSQRALKFN